MSTVRCDGCHGKRYLIGLGGMQKECPACRGVGYVKLVSERAKPGPKKKEK
jgi:DnaJ-class molecular chaperone